MLFKCRIEGTSPIIMHSTAGLDPRSPWNIEKSEIAKKRGSNRTEVDDARLRELETLSGLYLDDRERPTIPGRMIRAALEGGARKIKEGPLVREGVVVRSVDKFEYDVRKYGRDLKSLCLKTQFTVDVRVSRARILKTRPKFDLPWAVEFTLDADDDLADAAHIERWLDLAGRRLGIGDWRPQCSGDYGTFEVASVRKVAKK